ncbi:MULTISPECIES: MarR family winged helix-turn-helix transcriptional regulator [unclassified Ornithinimicrobium]|uniref:MarR family winged helix-turn-helix transcriptional regulator n=1 Tax=unclassified Ornithinimicrobium TaxID=2615080 RepID=UPI003855300A
MTASPLATPRTDLGQLGTDPVFMLIRAGAVGRARGNEVLRKMGLKTRDYSIISTAATREITQKELADFLMLNPSQVVSLVDDLETRGLVKRTTSPHDRRAKIVVPTAKGEKVFAEARERLTQTHEVLFAPLSTQERETLLRILPQLAFPADLAV